MWKNNKEIQEEQFIMENNLTGISVILSKYPNKKVNVYLFCIWSKGKYYLTILIIFEKFILYD